MNYLACSIAVKYKSIYDVWHYFDKTPPLKDFPKISTGLQKTLTIVSCECISYDICIELQYARENPRLYSLNHFQLKFEMLATKKFESCCLKELVIN
jgi:hypothetical protein